MSDEQPRFYEFDSFLLDAERRELMREGEVVALMPKVFDTLLVFVQNRGRVLEKNELMETLWADSFVEEANLTQNVSTLRRILGETPHEKKYIMTIPGRGYRFVAEVQELPNETTDVVIHEKIRARLTIEKESANELQKTELKLIAPPQPKKSYWKFIIAGILTLIVLSGFYWFLVRPKNTVELTNFKPTRLTTTGKTKRAAISPDGKYIAYAAQDGTMMSLWLRQTATGANVNIIPSATRGYIGLTFSHTGEYLYCVYGEEGVPAKLIRIASLGGSEMQLSEDIDSPVALSPDESQIAFLRGFPDTKEIALIIAGSDGSSERKVLARPNTEGFLLFTNPIWTNDGQKIISVVKNKQFVELVEIDTVSGNLKTIGSKKWAQIERMALTPDGLSLIFTAAEDDASPQQIWQMSYESGEARKITNDLSSYSDLTLTADGKNLVTLESDKQSNIFVVSKDDFSLDKQITGTNYEGAGGLSFTPDRKIVYAAQNNGVSDLWMADADGANAKQLTFNAGNNQFPAVSPDGRFIAFSSNRTGIQNLWLMKTDGGPARPLTNGASDSFPVWSPDGRWIFYQSRIDAIPNIFKIPVEGGEAIRLTNKISGRPTVSPDGNLFACLYREETLKSQKLAIFSVNGGAPQKQIELSKTSAPLVWAADGQAITFISARGKSSNIWSQAIEGSEAKQITNFNGEQIFWFAWSKDFQTLAVSRGTIKSDAFMLRFDK